MLYGQPVAVEVKPVVVGAASRPGFVQFALGRVTVHIICLVGVNPRSKSVEAVGIDGRIKKEYDVFKFGGDFIRCRKVVGRE